MQRITGQLSYANVVASLALFLVLGGGVAYAATHLGKNSVGAKQLKANAVTGIKIKDNAVTGAKVRDGSLSAADLHAGTIPAPTAGSGASVSPATFTSAGLPDANGECGTATGFVNYKPDTYERVGYYREPNGIVHLQGTAQQCSPYDGIVFSLPPGFRPIGFVYYLAANPANQAEVVHVAISATGSVSTSLPNVSVPVSLDGITFRCGPPGGAGCP